jgi:DinB family protein
MNRTLCSLAFALIVAAPSLAGADPMTAGERQRVLAHFEMTEAWLVSETNGLSNAQLAFRMTPESWSIQDVVEHLAIAEPQYWQQVQDSLKQPVGYKAEQTDAAILWYGIDRTNRQKTGEARVPKGKYSSVGQSLGDFRKLRATMTEFAKGTQEDLRGRQLQGGNMDVYQWLLMISTHSQRHILQIREVKAHASYPKK